MLKFDIDRPDAVLIKGAGEWERDDGRVSVKNGRVLIASGAPVAGVRLIYAAGFERGARFFGDDWERAYGALQWRGQSSERLMPWYMAVDEGGVMSFMGVKTGPAAFVGVRATARSVIFDIDVRSGSGSVRLENRELAACDIVAEFNAEGPAFAFIRKMLKRLCPAARLADHPVYGGNNWYYAYGKSSREEILADSAFISRMAEDQANRPYMVIDDGWQKHSPDGLCNGGPWTGNPGYGDMAKLARDMKSAGVRTGIWIRPLLMAEKPADEWITGAEGESWFIDPTNPDVLRYVSDTVRRLADEGYDLIKHDFTTYDIFRKWGFHVGGRPMAGACKMADDTRTNAEIILNLYRTISEAAGDTVIIGCNTVSHLAAGIFQIQRTGDDTSGRNWERTRYMGINTLAMRMPQHRIFYDCDADCSPITPALDPELAAAWLDVLSRSGTPLFVSARPGTLTHRQEAQVAEAFARAAVNTHPAEPLDWQDTTAPRVWKCEDGIYEYDFDPLLDLYDGGEYWR